MTDDRIRQEAERRVTRKERYRVNSLSFGIPGLSARFEIGDVDEVPSEEKAFRRQKWRESAERETLVRNVKFSILTGILVCVIVTTVFLIPWAGNPAFYSQQAPIMWLSFVAVSYAVFGYSLLRARTLKQQLYDRIILGIGEVLSREESAIAQEAPNGEINFATLWAATQRRLDYYHNIAAQQSTNSFRNGQVATGIGFFVVAGLGVAATFASDATRAIAASIVAASGAALSGFIGATYMRMQREASAQLRQYFMQPVEFSRILGAERLIEAISDEAERGRAVQEIVKAMMTPNAPKDS